MTTDKNFVDGMRFTDPRERAPKFIRGHISVNVPKFLEYASANQDARGWLNIDIKESKSGTLYLELNVWKPRGGPPESTKDEGYGEASSDELPF